MALLILAWQTRGSLLPHSLTLTKTSDSSPSCCLEILVFVNVPFCFGLHREGICTVTSFDTATRLEWSQPEPFVPQWCYDISVSVHINAVLEAACTRGDVQPLWEDVPAQSTRIPFGSIFIFYAYCRWGSCFCKYSVHELFYSFILSIANCRVNTVWFYFFPLLPASAEVRGVKANCSWEASAPPATGLSAVCGVCVHRVRDMTIYLQSFIWIFYICVLLTIISCSGAFFSKADPTLAVKIPF